MYIVHTCTVSTIDLCVLYQQYYNICWSESAMTQVLCPVSDRFSYLQRAYPNDTHGGLRNSGDPQFSAIFASMFCGINFEKKKRLGQVFVVLASTGCVRLIRILLIRISG